MTQRALRRWHSMAWPAALVLATIGLAGSGSPASAETLAATAATQTVVSAFAADADTRVHEASPTTNYGSRVVLRVDGATDPDIESYLRFTVSGLAGSVQRATLRLHATAGTVDGPTVAGTSDSWAELAVTWSDRPAPTTAAVDDEGPIATGSWVELDVTSLVPANGTFSFALAATSTDGVDFDSRESSSTSLRPELVVEALTSGAPIATSPPTISGIPQEGQTLTGSPGTWNGSQPIAFANQWQRCDSSGGGCTDLANQTGDTYVVDQSDIGSRLRLVVTATNVDGSGAATSAPFGVVTGVGDIVIAAAGDIAGCTQSVDSATAQLLDSIAPHGVLTLGDNVYPDGADAEFTGCYDPTWGTHKMMTHPSVGNHDYHQLGASGYFNYFGAAAGDPTNGYYAVDFGAWRFYALNSNCAVVPCSAGSAQEQWLRDDLMANPRTCTAAFMHHPRFASGASGVRRDNPSMGALYQAFYEASGDLWLVGHNHQYERLSRLSPTGAIDLEQGIRNFVAGTGGAGLYVFGPPVTGSEVRSMTHGVLKLTLRAGGYDWEFVPVPGSSFTDAGTDVCGAAAPDTTPPSDPTSLTTTSAGAGSVSLSWGASTDFGAVVYDVYRDAQLLESTTTTSYTDTTAVAGATYDYYVKARDAAGNVSGASNTVTVTVAASSIVAFGAEADARVLEAKPGMNFGNSSSLRTDGGSDPDVESYLRFGVSGLSGPVQRAVLRVFASNGTIDGPAVYGTGNGWVETGITWSTRPVRTTGGIDDEGLIVAGTWVEYDVTSLVTGDGTFSFVLATTSTDSVDFESRNSNQAAVRPQLVVTFG